MNRSFLTAGLLLMGLVPMAVQAQPAEGSTRRASDINFECSQSHVASLSLDRFVEAYERNDIATIRSRLDPALIGFQRFIDGVQLDFTRLKQLRLFLKDRQMQCGPDVTVINATWEKRFLELNTFQPGLQTGRMSILLHRNGDQWRLAAVGGDSPFGASAAGTAGDLDVAGVVDISALSVLAPPRAPAVRRVSAAAPTVLSLPITVVDADQAGRGSVAVVVTTSTGDRETFMLPETSPGRFFRNGLPFSAEAMAVGDGVIQVAAGTTLTVNYVDATPGGNRPAAVLTRTLRSIGTPIIIDGTPDPFFLAPAGNVATGSAVTSLPITVSGINTSVPISVVGGSYAINGGAFTAAPGVVGNGAQVTVRVTAAGSPGASVTAVLNIGGVSSNFVVTTLAADTIPDPFFFAPQNNVAPGSLVTSAPITVSGINAPAGINIIGGRYSINGGAFTTAPGTVSQGQNVTVQLTASGITNGAGVAIATLNIGGVSGNFTATTWDTEPNPFNWPAAGACAGAFPTIDSFPTLITGLTAAASISIADGGGSPAPAAQYSINGGPFTSAPGSVSNGQTVTLRINRYLTLNPLAVRAVVNIGGISGTWSTSCP